MCLAIPNKVIKINNSRWAVVEENGLQRRVGVDLISDVKVGDYLFVHDDLAVSKIPKGEAKKIAKMAEHCHCHE